MRKSIFRIYEKRFPFSLQECQLYNSAWNLDYFNEKFFGCLTSISIKKILNHTYIHMENGNESTVQTMLVCVPSESFSNEIEVLSS